MLTFHNSLDHSQIAVGLDAAALLQEVNWIDALDPTREETAFIERALALVAPSRERMSEIETSSRLYRLGDTLYLTHLHDLLGCGQNRAIDAARLRARQRSLIDDAVSIDQGLRCETIQRTEHRPRDVRFLLAAFISLLEEIVDQLADELESQTADLDDLAGGVFLDPNFEKRGRAGGAHDLRLALHKIGQALFFASKISETLLGIVRMQPFLTGSANDLSMLKIRLQFDRIGTRCSLTERSRGAPVRPHSVPGSTRP